MQNQQPLKIFIAFANEDRDVRDKLLAQMNLLKVREHWDIWASHEIKAGSVWNDEIKERLNDSEVVVLLMSSSFFNSNYILDVELPAIIEKHRNGYGHIIPVLAKKCLWKDTPFGDYIDLGKIQALPSGERPIVSKGAWDSDDDPFVETVLGIKASVRDFKIKKAEQDRLQQLEIQKKQKEWQKVEAKVKAQPSHLYKFLYLNGVGLIALIGLLFWIMFEGSSKKSDKTNELESQGESLIKQESIDSQSHMASIQNDKRPNIPSVAYPDSQSVKSHSANKIFQESNLPTNSTTEKPKTTTTKIAKGPGTGRWAVRSGTFTYMEGARRRLEFLIKAGYPNAEISKTSEGHAAVIVYRSNDKNAAIRVANDLETKGIDAAVFDRKN